MINAQNKENSNEDYRLLSPNSTMKLIHLVQAQEILYNSSANGYTDQNRKEIAWDAIQRTIFPQYDKLSGNMQEMIRTNVRRRWKALRNLVSRYVRKKATVENYICKMDSPLLSELEFLIPHIKSAYSAKVADELALRDSYTIVNESDVIEEDQKEEDEDFSDLIDLTLEYDIKPAIKLEQSYHVDNDTSSSETFPNNIHYPFAQLNGDERHTTTTTTNTSTNEPNTIIHAQPNVQAHDHSHQQSPQQSQQQSQQQQNQQNSSFNWSNDFCTVAEYADGEFRNSTVLCTNQDTPDNSVDKSSNADERKRPRMDTETNAQEVQVKIMQLLTNLEQRVRHEGRTEPQQQEAQQQEVQDDDRMFLLSLVSDLKRVPTAKKMLVKAEIATVIARAIP